MTKDGIVSFLNTLDQLDQQRHHLKRQIEWLKQQLFGGSPSAGLLILMR